MYIPCLHWGWISGGSVEVRQSIGQSIDRSIHKLLTVERLIILTSPSSPSPPLVVGKNDVNQVQVHPTGLMNSADPNNLSKMLAPEAMRGSGGVLVNGSGERFCNELDTRAAVTAAIMANCTPAMGSQSKVAFLVSIPCMQIKDAPVGLPMCGGRYARVLTLL